MHKPTNRQDGAILVLTVLFLIIMLVAAALVVDVGRLHVLRTQMQNAADSAAMAGAVELNGQEGAWVRAVEAATQMLSHSAPFSSSTNKDLLAHLEDYYDPSNPEDGVFVFYSWIGSEYDDTDNIPCSTFTSDGKCLAVDYTDAKYIRVTLDPLLTDEEGDYGIDFYFAPSLALFLGGDPTLRGTTRVTAVGGAGGPRYCEYPPMFMCAYAEGTPERPGVYPGIEHGQQVRVKARSASGGWGPGNVGFLEVGEEVTVPLDNGGTMIEKNLDALAAAIGNEFLERQCTPAIVSTEPGEMTQKTRQALNTRFGLYEAYDNAKNAFPAAPNTVDYPMDDAFTVENPDDYIDDPDVYPIGEGWANNDTECLEGINLNDECNGYTRPETFSAEDYIDRYHSTPPVGTYNSRYALYEWENQNILPELRTSGLNIDDRNATSQEDCSQRSVGKPGSKHCLLQNGDPLNTPPNPIGEAERRVLRIAVIKCDEQNIQGNTPDIDLNYNGEFPFHEFFLTQHAQAPSDTEFFVEYIGPVAEEEEIQIIRHKIIQLYE